MKLTTTTTKLLNLISKVLPAVPNKSVLQILRNVSFKLHNQTLELHSTDLDMSINTIDNIEHQGDFDFIIEARKLSGILSGLPKNQKLTLTKLDIVSVNIKSGDFSANMAIHDIMEFPGFPQINPIDRLNIKSKDLAGLSQVVTSVSNNQTKPAICGVSIQSNNDDEVTFVASDEYTMVELNHRSPKLSRGYLIPPRALSTINKLVGNEDIRVKLSDKFIQFDINETTVIHSVLDSKFPNYKRFIPDEFNYKIETNRVELLEALKELSTCLHEKNKTAKFQIENSELKLTVVNPNFGLNATRTLDIRYDGDSFEIGLSCLRMIELLSKLSGEEVSLNMNGFKSPCIILPVGEEEFNPVLLAMPLILK